jgi:hypothetical protein
MIVMIGGVIIGGSMIVLLAILLGIRMGWTGVIGIGTEEFICVPGTN